MNDPNGVIQWQGQYHLFYQHNPGAPLWSNMHWGHAVSPDLVHWTDLPIALAPTPGGYDEAGVFSGCAVNDNGVPTLVYTGTSGPRSSSQVQCLATSQDGLLTWAKHPRNPVLATTPPESGQSRDFRDPFVWKDGERWLMVLGSRIQDVGGAIFLYQSTNLTDWEYLHPLLVGDIQRNGVVWECPNFFPLGDQWVLIISTHLGTMTNLVIYFVGSFENDQFTPIHEGVLDYDRLYAPLSLRDDQDRRILFGWLRESRDNDALTKAGWAGAMSIPRVLALDEQHHLLMTPVPELATLRGQHQRLTPSTLDSAAEVAATGLALDIEARFQPAHDAPCGLSLLFSPETQEKIDIVYDATAQQLRVTAQVCAADGELTTTVHEAPHEHHADAPLQFRILLDGSVVEIIVDQRTSLSTRVYPSSAQGATLSVVGPRDALVALDAWHMPSIWQ